MPLTAVADWYYKAELAALLAETDLTQKEVADHLGVTVRTIFNWITGETRPKAGMAMSLARVCGASEKRSKFLGHVIKQLDVGMIELDLETRNIFIIERAEATSGEVWKWEPLYLPGPLQTWEYHLELLPEPSPHPRKNWERKLRRLQALGPRNPAPALRFLVSAIALWEMRHWSGAEAQFNYLMEINRWPNCEIRILEGLHFGNDHAYELYLPAGMPDAAPPFVFIESIDQSRHLESKAQIELYHGRMVGMWESASMIEGRLDDWIR
ncbi:Scr1 family TA system antitoxin-like transcriptional regulator [Glycomyces dulcitolivorans]|uniref:Scr1 family TA system antitoxin-like transcriptional regulator n=1 Tax=Glycomyces dulcitolivorans TaxID=2200759 RepID=UPI000DD4DAF6|nr:Scr1 family TA system antitoxin-like transcriptional regulator [Glycomyces dulcitolivorans]